MSAYFKPALLNDKRHYACSENTLQCILNAVRMHHDRFSSFIELIGVMVMNR